MHLSPAPFSHDYCLPAVCLAPHPAISSLFTLFTPTVCPLRLLPFHQVRLDRRDHG